MCGFMSVLSAFCNKTKWISWLHLVVLFLSVVLFTICVFSVFFSFPSPKQAKKKNNKNRHGKTPKITMQKKGMFFFSVGAVVLTDCVPIFWGGLKLFC